MKNKKINAWAVYNEKGDVLEITTSRRLGYIQKRKLEVLDIDGLKIRKCKIIIEQ